MSEHHHLSSRGILRSRVRSSVAAVLGVALAGVGATACAPEPPPPLAACPSRTAVLLEPADPVNFSMPRAVSPDGEWLVVSRVVADDLTLSLRRTQTAGSSTPVGRLPYAQVGEGTLLVSVPADGSQVVVGIAGAAYLPDSPQTTLYRWRAATGAVSELPVPVVASPPPGVPYPMNAVALSADGKRVLWTQSFLDGSGPYVFHRVLVVTDATTDAVLSTASIDGISLGAITDDGAVSLAGNQLVATATGAVTDLAPELAAAQAAFPGPQLAVDGISGDLRYLSMRRYDSSVVPGVLTYLVWDRNAGSGRVALEVPTTGQAGQPQVQFNAVTSEGSLLVTRWGSLPNLGDVVESHPTAGVLTVASSATGLTPQFSWMVGTSDGRTVVISRQSPIGQQLVAQRCA